MNHRPRNSAALTPEALAVLLTLLVIGARMTYEAQLSVQAMAFLEQQAPGPVPLPSLVHLVKQATLRPAFIFTCLFTFPLCYLPVYGLTTIVGSISSPGTDLTGGSLAQNELERD